MSENLFRNFFAAAALTYPDKLAIFVEAAEKNDCDAE